MKQFVDRDLELDQLTDCYTSETADFVVIYGRRRLGKSELVRQSIAERDDAVYGNQDQLRILGDDACEELVAPELADYRDSRRIHPPSREE